ncbi:hypothetical protein Sros01_56890 [Streptomyces roseochromogenus]|nr:hypothetical protein Sros01_56890 [Streptomyces roseochromogenus]
MGEELEFVVVHAAAGLVHALLLGEQAFTLAHVRCRWGGVRAAGGVAGVLSLRFVVRSGLGRVPKDRHPLVLVRSRHPWGGGAQSIAPDGSNALGTTCSS